MNVLRRLAQTPRCRWSRRLFAVLEKVPKQNPYAAFVKAAYHRAEGDSLAQKIKNIGATWRSLSPQERAKWEHQKQPVVPTSNADLAFPTDKQRTGAAPQRVKQAPAPKVRKRSAYSAYMKAHYHQVGGDGLPQKIKKIGAMWRVLSPQSKAEWAPDVAGQTTEHIPPKNPSSAMSLYMKATMADTPKGSPQNRLRYIGAQWTALPSDSKAVWIRKAAELRSMSPRKAQQALQQSAEGVMLKFHKTKRVLVAKATKYGPYAAYIKATYHLTEGDSLTEKAKRIVAQWRTLDTQEKAIWADRARAQSTISSILVVPKVKIPNAMSLFVKEKMIEAPPGLPQERLRFVGMQWRALSDEEKAIWVKRAAELKLQSNGSIHKQVLHGHRNVYVRPHKRLPDAMQLFYNEKKAEAQVKSPQKLMRHTGAEWNALSSEEKQTWERKAADLQQAMLQTACRTFNSRSGYNVFLGDRLVALGGKMSLVAAEWQAAGPRLREQYNRRAAELNAAAIAQSERRKMPSSPRYLSTMGMYVKEKMAEAPKGTPQERMIHLGAQWRSLSSEEKAVWTRKAAEFRRAILQKAPVPSSPLHI